MYSATMISYSFLVLFFTTSVLCNDEFLHPCSVKDIECLRKSTEKFLKKTAPGISEYGFRPIDPLVIPSLDIVIDEEAGLVFHFNGLNITGLKKQDIYDFRMDTTANSVVLKTKADLHLAGILAIELTKASKRFTGLSTIESTMIGATQYSYEIKMKDTGVDYFEVGPETNTCEYKEDPKVVLESILRKQLEEYSKKWESEFFTLENRRKMMCEITKIIYSDVIHNIRTAATILPKTAFFTDV